jgi:ubiquinone/menaquinone biosynthesis C-methylase UbiE
MDDPRISVQEMKGTLREIDLVNRFLGGWSASLWLLRRVMAGMKEPAEISLLDLGAGSGGSARAMMRWGRRRGCKVRITLADIHPAVCKIAQRQNGSAPVVRADALKLPFQDRSFDFAHASLFLHHFSNEEIHRILREMKRVARRGVLINDLERHSIALGAIEFLTKLFARSRLVRHDAPLSVRRGFRLPEVETWRLWVGFEGLRIRRRFPFRILVWDFAES